MEKAAAAGARTAGTHKELRNAACAALALCCIAGPAAGAQDATSRPAEVLVAQARTEPALRVQVQTSTVPRVDAQDSGFQAQRVDVSLIPSHRGYGLGAVVGVTGFSAMQPQQPVGLGQQRPSFDLGLRWTQRVQSQQVDITAWRRMNAEDDAYSLVQSRQPVYGARLEMSLAAAAKGPLALDRGFIGLQLESGARISFKRKDGRPMIYYRTAF
jgi:hypothetical protein